MNKFTIKRYFVFPLIAIFLFTSILGALLYISFKKPFDASAAGTVLTKTARAASPFGSTTNVDQGSNVKWVVGYNNTSGVTKTNVQVDDTFATANQTFVSGSVQTPPGWTSNVNAPASGNQTVNFNAASVGPGATSSLSGLLPPLTAVSTAIGTGGDGYMPILMGNDRAYAIYHHWPQGVSVVSGQFVQNGYNGSPVPNFYNIQCVDLLTNNICTGYPKYFSSQNGTSNTGPRDMVMANNSYTVQDGDKIYFSAQRPNDVGIGCWDTTTDSNCGYVQLGNLSYVPGSNWNTSLSGLQRVGDNIYMSARDINMYCMSLISLTACPSQPYSYAGSLLPAVNSVTPNNNISIPSYVDGTRIYQIYNYAVVSPSSDAKMTCFDTATNALCSGNWSTSLIDIPPNLSYNPTSYSTEVIPIFNTSGTVDAFCAASFKGINSGLHCYDKNTQAPYTPPSTYFSGITNTAVGDNMKEMYSSAKKVGNYVYYAMDTVSLPGSGTWCVDITTGAGCSTFGVNGWKQWTSVSSGNTFDYGYEYYKGCMYGLGHSGVLWSFDPITGSTPCSRSTATMQLSPQAYYCDGQPNNIQNYGQVIINIPSGATVNSADVLLYDGSNTTPLAQSGTMTISGTQAVLDISAVPLSVTTLRVEISAFGSWSSSLQTQVTFVGSPVQFCFQTQVANVCNIGSISNLVTSDSTTASKTMAVNESALLCSADLSVAKTHVGTGPFYIGDTITYKISVRNEGGSPVKTFKLDDTFSNTNFDNVNFVDVKDIFNGTFGMYNTTSNIWTAPSGNLLDPNETVVFTFTAHVLNTAANPVPNLAIVSQPTNNSGEALDDNNGSNNSATDQVPLTTTTDLSVAKTHTGTDPFYVGDTITYQITVQNNSGAAVKTFQLNDTFSNTNFDNVNFIDVRDASNNLYGTYSNSTHIWTAPNGTPLQPGTRAVFTFTAKVLSTASNPVPNSAVVSNPKNINNVDLTDTNPNNNTANDQANLQTTVDLAIDKTHTGASTYNLGDQVTYKLTVTNVSGGAVGSFKLDDTYANTDFSSFTFVDTRNGTNFLYGTYNTSTKVWTAPNGLPLNVGSTVTFTFIGTIASTASNPTINTGTISEPKNINNQDLTDNNSLNNTDSDQVNVVTSTDLAVAKTHVGAGPFYKGDTVTYKITVTNAGTTSLGSFKMVDTFGNTNFDNVTFVDVRDDANNIYGTYNTSTGVWTAPNLGSFDSLATLTFTFRARVLATASNPTPNTAVVSEPRNTNNLLLTDTNPNNDTANDQIPLTTTTDLSVIKTHTGSNTYYPGDTVTYKIAVRNESNTPVQSFRLDDTYASTNFTSVTFVDVRNASNTLYGTYNITTKVWTAPNGTPLAAATTITFTFNGVIATTSATSAPNTATISQPKNINNQDLTDTDSNNNSSTDAVNVLKSTDIAIIKSHQGANAYQTGDLVTYVFNIVNNGPAEAKSVVVTDDYATGKLSNPRNFTVVNPSSGVTYNPTSHLLSFATTFAVGQTVSISYQANIATNVSGDVVNTVTVTNPIDKNNNPLTDTNPANNTDVNLVTAAPTVDLGITKTHTGGNGFRSGDNITYTFTVTNYGPNTVKSFNLNDTFPTGLSNPRDFTPSQGTYNDQTKIWTLATPIAPNQNATMTVVATVNNTITNGALTNLVEISNPKSPTDVALTDTNPNNNTATDAVQLAIISGNIFYDANNNGVKDVGEPDLPNVSVAITDTHGTFTVVTDANGNYQIYVIPGQVTADVDETDPDIPAEVKRTTDANGGFKTQIITITAGENRGAVDVGYYKAPPIIPRTGGWVMGAAGLMAGIILVGSFSFSGYTKNRKLKKMQGLS